LDIKHLAPPKYKTDGEYLAEFVPRCLDCRYELTGLEDGNCPECGLAFRMYALERRWISRQRARDEGLREALALRVMAPFWLAGLVVLGLFSEVFAVFVVLLASWVAAVVVIRRLWEAWLEANPHAWLLTLLPLASMAVGASASRYPTVALGCCAVAALAVSWIALKGSPLWTTVILAPFGPGFLFLTGAAMLVQGLRLRAQGAYWSDFDWPAYPRAAALPVERSILVGCGGVGVSAARAGVMLMHVRRARVRLLKGNWE